MSQNTITLLLGIPYAAFLMVCGWRLRRHAFDPRQPRRERVLVGILASLVSVIGVMMAIGIFAMTRELISANN
jgi:hypothetical protein